MKTILTIVLLTALGPTAWGQLLMIPVSPTNCLHHGLRVKMDTNPALKATRQPAKVNLTIHIHPLRENVDSFAAFLVVTDETSYRIDGTTNVVLRARLGSSGNSGIRKGKPVNDAFYTVSLKTDMAKRALLHLEHWKTRKLYIVRLMDFTGVAEHHAARYLPKAALLSKP